MAARQAEGGAPALSVGFVLARNFTLTALSSFIDTLRLAADDGDGSRPIRCRWSVLGARGAATPASCGIEIRPDAPLSAPEAYDYIVVVGGLLQRGPQIDAEQLAFLRRAAAAKTPLIGVCTGSFVLCRAGLMKGRRCCVSWYHHQDFIDEFPDIAPVSDQLFVMDRDRITCSGGAGVVDLAACLIERHLGRGAAQKAVRILQVERARPTGAAQPHPPLSVAVMDERVRRAILLMEQNIAKPLAMEALAARLALSTRQFERLFSKTLGKSPSRFYRDLRLRHGRRLLRETSRSVTLIAQDAGFADCAHFSREFRAAFGQSPSAARAEGPSAAPRSALAERDRILFDDAAL